MSNEPISLAPNTMLAVQPRVQLFMFLYPTKGVEVYSARTPPQAPLVPRPKQLAIIHIQRRNTC